MDSKVINSLLCKLSTIRISSLRSYSISILMNCLLLLLLVSSCDVDGDSDICCDDVVLTYRYVRQERDEYKQFVRTMRHFLFDERGRFIREVAFNAKTPQQLRLLKLPVGNYTIVTVGNATEGTSSLSALSSQSSLHDFKLSVIKQFDAGSLGKGDELFWSTRTFVSERNKRHRYICDLSNIHCHLFVKISWKKKPPYTGNKYMMQLEGVTTRNTLDPTRTHITKIISSNSVSGSESTDKRVVQTFPGLDGAFGTYRIAEQLYGVRLYGEFVSLRYTNKHIPTFRLYYGDKAVTKPIDLSRAFAAWNWRPDEQPEQIYRIEMEILDDETVVVNQWAQTSVKDWEDGGTVEVKQ